MLLVLALSTKSVLEEACTYECVCVCASVCVQDCVGRLEETTPPPFPSSGVQTKALCLRRGDDTFAEQKKLNTILASVPHWSYDTAEGEKNSVRAAPISESTAESQTVSSRAATINHCNHFPSSILWFMSL